MLDSVTKRRIDTARDILVGKVPDPKSQVEQITIALIYKFMDDMDAESEELGGSRRFFTGDFAKYGWPQLMSPRLGGHEMLGLYGEGIARMPQNPGVPPLFRDIFKNAYLPYRDPETLKAFLKIIGEFTYDHSERLGDAFEYLLSVLGSQGDAGQFRTPRHIIDWIVEVVAPKKGEVILDPACGTAGFLISAYKHIERTSVGADGASTLTPDDRARMAKNLVGYDISPDMVRLSLANLYLHGFTQPHVHEYDTLTSEDRWNEHADVILANPPFMSPKGGIRPHRRFSIQAKRSEVLFVDYIVEHLTPTGRAGIIVPEGIIFQTQGAYVALRKLLVEQSLVAVVSLPAGVFNPYSNVKTSILILDRAVAKHSTTIGFFKIENDGFSLGAQRREITANDLPQVRDEIAEYLRRLRARESLEGFTPGTGHAVTKASIAADGDFTLSGDRYLDAAVRSSAYPLVGLADLCTLVRGVVFSKEDEVEEGGVEVLRANNIDKDRCRLDLTDVLRVKPKNEFSPEQRLSKNDIFICLASGSKAHVGKVAFVTQDTQFFFGGFMGAIRVKEASIDARYLFSQLSSSHFNDFLRREIVGASINNLSGGILYRYQIPLPPLDVQREIVAEIEGYQRVIDGARAVVDNYRPRIAVDPAWPTKPIGEVCTLLNGRAFKPTDWAKAESGGLPIVRIQNLNNPDADFNYFTGEVAPRNVIDTGELLFSWSGSRGTSFGAHLWRGPRAVLNQHIFKVEFSPDQANKTFLLHALNGAVDEVEDNLHGGVGLVHITKGNLERITIPLPSLAEQDAVAAELDREQALVDGTRELIHRFEMKIQATLARLWGEGAVNDAADILEAAIA